MGFGEKPVCVSLSKKRKVEITVDENGENFVEVLADKANRGDWPQVTMKLCLRWLKPSQPAPPRQLVLKAGSAGVLDHMTNLSPRWNGGWRLPNGTPLVR